MSNTKIYHHSDVFVLESGKTIENLTIAYHTYGQLNDSKDNVVWICHALTANSDVLSWWQGLFGNDDLFNPQEYFIVCANIIGSPYGSTHPLSLCNKSGKPFYLNFPLFTIRDIAAAHQLLANHLNLERINILVGGSMGGQQAMEWAISNPSFFDKLILIATNAVHSPWGIAFNESQRLAISADPTFYSPFPQSGKSGLKAARSIALLSYRGYETYLNSQKEDEAINKTDDFKAASYQNYQGEKLTERFDAYSYWYLSKAMDTHNVGRGRGGVERALGEIQAQSLVIGISSDILFPLAEQELLANYISDAEYSAVDSLYGHDGFLIETPAISNRIKTFLRKE